MNALVVFYSRSGNTRRLARWIAAGLEATLEEIGEDDDRRGFFGYLRSGNQAFFHRRVPIHPPRHDPRRYDLVVIGTPVWRMSMSSPVRTYVEQYAGRLSNVAFFCTMDRFGAKRVFRQMQRACGVAPQATLARTVRDLQVAELPQVVASFVAQLRPPPDEEVTAPA